MKSSTVTRFDSFYCRFFNRHFVQFRNDFLKRNIMEPCVFPYQIKFLDVLSLFHSILTDNRCQNFDPESNKLQPNRKESKCLFLVKSFCQMTNDLLSLCCFDQQVRAFRKRKRSKRLICPIKFWKFSNTKKTFDRSINKFYFAMSFHSRVSFPTSSRAVWSFPTKSSTA